MLGISRLCVNTVCSKSLYCRLPNYAFQTNNIFNKTNPISRKILTSNQNTLKCSNHLKNLSINTSRSSLQFKLSQAFKNGTLLLGRSISRNAQVKEETSKAVGYWLLTCSGMVFVAVILGGVTRLTESGLSMVTWKLMGEKMPWTREEWEAEFLKYQKFPEFKYKNSDMTISEFKQIWFMEYGHRMWGRCIGAAVFLPAMFFWLRGYLNKGMKIRVTAYCYLVCAQGFLGWYMVQSGLEDRFQDPSDVPRVSQYRLAAHLSLAFILYTGLLAGALKVFRAPPVGAVYNMNLARVPSLKAVTILSHTAKALVFLTAVSGAFVAGLDAGLVYNSFPKMGDNWIPDDILAMSPTLKNFAENPTTVQFDHRILGTLTLTAISALWLISRKKTLPPQARTAVNALGLMAWVQVGLGISTLLMYVPTHLAATHQSGSLILLSLAIWLSHEMKLLRLVPK